MHKVARIRYPPGPRPDLTAFERIASRYGYRVEAVEDPGVPRVLVELDGMVFPGTDPAARYLAWVHLKRLLGGGGRA